MANILDYADRSLSKRLITRLLPWLFAAVVAVFAWSERGYFTQWRADARLWLALRDCLNCTHSDSLVAVELMGNQFASSQYPGKDFIWWKSFYRLYRFYRDPALARLDGLGPDPYVFDFRRGGAVCATVFLHERKTRAGVRRLVLVSCAAEDWPRSVGERQLNGIFGRLLDPTAPLAALAWDPTIFDLWWSVKTKEDAVKSGVRRFVEAGIAIAYFGQPDTVDDSKFSIRVITYANVEETIDGVLVDDGAGGAVLHMSPRTRPE